MKVKELIELLQDCDPETMVLVPEAYNTDMYTSGFVPAAMVVSMPMFAKHTNYTNPLSSRYVYPTVSSWHSKHKNKLHNVIVITGEDVLNDDA